MLYIRGSYIYEVFYKRSFTINPLKTSPEYTQAGVYGKRVL